MSTPQDWGRAFAKQAQADFRTWNELGRQNELPKSQKLHFLQMACEKLAKAHLCKSGLDPYSLQSSHAYIAKTLPIIARQQFPHRAGKTIRDRTGVVKRIKHLAREIELLSPAVDDNKRRPDNCEYPWEDAAGKLHVPAEYTFPNLTLLTHPGGRTFLNFIHRALRQLT